MRIRDRAVLLFAAIVLLAFGLAGGAEVAMRPADTVEKDTAWEGKVLVERPITVRKGATLTVKPGAVVSFAKGAGLVVEGILIAKGSAEAPIRFVSANGDPSPGDWEGIRFEEPSAGSILSRCVILGASAVDIAGRGIEVRDCEIGKGKTGLIVRQRSNPKVTGNSFGDMTGGGILCAQGSSPWIEGNIFRSCGPFGIAGDRNAAPVVRGNVISECEKGLAFNGVIPPVEGNVFRKNGGGIVVISAGSLLAIRANRFEGNKTGLSCEQFSDPLVEGNTFTGNVIALVCFRSSSPRIRRNEIAGNEQGIVCSQLCRPRIEGNEIRGNRRGIYLTFSSYATVTGNNIHGNDVQMELGMMSSDWERKTGEKPVRGSAAQQATQANRGIVPFPQRKGEEGVVKASVDATGNWWGEKGTEEMERKGPEANIGGLVDYYDAPVHPSEGSPGVYEQDRIRYEGWRKSRVPDAGLPKGSSEEFTGFRGWVSVNGERIPGVTVYAYREYERGPASGPVALSEPSRPDGTFSVALPTGSYFLVAAKTESGDLAGLRTGDLYCFFGGNPVRVEEGRPSFAALSLQEVGGDPEPAADYGITGTVYDERGNPLSGAVVYAYKSASDGFKGMPGVFTRTREDGTFHLRVRKGTFFVLARKRGSGELFGPTLPGDYFGFYPGNPVSLAEGRGKGIRIDAQPRQAMQEKLGDAYAPAPAIVLRARVVDGAGRPAAGVRLLAYRNEVMTGFPAYVSSRSKKDGSVDLEVAEEGTYFLLARENLGGPAEGELYGKFTGTKDHSVKVTRDGAAGTVEIVVERK